MPNQLISVLDHGFVRLTDHMGSDLAVVRNARNSHDASWRAGLEQGSDQRLINYLWRNAHTTPFEAVTFTFEIKCPIFVARQWHRHRTWSYNEVSARYTELPAEFYVPDPQQIGTQDTVNRQGRTLESGQSEMDVGQRALERQHQIRWYAHHCEAAFEQYKRAVTPWADGGWGWPRELARCFLPVSTYTKFFGTANLLNLFRFIRLRSDAHAQYEIRVYSDAIKELIRPLVPVCVAAFEENRRPG